MPVHRLFRFVVLIAVAWAVLWQSAQARVRESKIRDNRESREIRKLKRTLRSDFSGARITAERDGEIVVVMLATGEVTTLADCEETDHGELSRPYWSPDGKQVIVSVDGQARIYGLDGSVQEILTDQDAVYEPQFWVDPQTGERCVVFKDHDDESIWAQNANPGKTYRWRPSSNLVEKLTDWPCDGGLSADGRVIGDAVGHAMMRDLKTNETFALNGGDIACNMSTAPDNSHRVMHLIFPHVRFGIRNRYDRLVWVIYNPPRTSEWDTPRWSNHPDFCMAAVKTDEQDHMALIQISRKRTLVLRQFDGNWSVPQLWLPSGPVASRLPTTPIDKLKIANIDAYRARLTGTVGYGRFIADLRKAGGDDDLRVAEALEGWGLTMLKLADREKEPAQVLSMLREVAGLFEGHPLQQRAEQMLAAKRLEGEYQALEELRRLQDYAGPLEVECEDYAICQGELAAYAEQRQKMREMVDNILDNWAESECADRAEEIADFWQLNECDDDMDEDEGLFSVQFIGRVVEVSRPNAAGARDYPVGLGEVRYQVERVVDGELEESQIVITHVMVAERLLTDAARIKVGERHWVRCEPYELNETAARSPLVGKLPSRTKLPVYHALAMEEIIGEEDGGNVDEIEFQPEE